MRSPPPSLRHLLPAYRPLVPSTIMRARRQVQRVRDEKFPSVAALLASSVPPSGPEHHYACSETGTASTRCEVPRRHCAAYFQRTAPWSRAPLCVLGDRYSEYKMRNSLLSLRCLLPAYRPLVPSTIMRARRQIQRVRDEKFPSVYSSRQSSDAPTNVSVPERQHLDWCQVFINPVYQSPT